jgi:dynein light intermediate chain 1
LKRQPLKHNVIDRDKVVVPPNWDSWGKIRVLREGFDVEAINKGWSLDIEESYHPKSSGDAHANGTNGHTEDATPKVPGGATESYEELIRDPSLDALQAASAESNGFKLEVSSTDAQTFLGTQLAALDKLRQGAEPSGMDSSRLVRGRGASLEGEESLGDEARVNEHIGPVQFNMGGIQVDADDMLQRLKVKTNALAFGETVTNENRTAKATRLLSLLLLAQPFPMAKHKTRPWPISSPA